MTRPIFAAFLLSIAPPAASAAFAPEELQDAVAQQENLDFDSELPAATALPYLSLLFISLLG